MNTVIDLGSELLVDGSAVRDPYVRLLAALAGQQLAAGSPWVAVDKRAAGLACAAGPAAVGVWASRPLGGSAGSDHGPVECLPVPSVPIAGGPPHEAAGDAEEDDEEERWQAEMLAAFGARVRVAGLAVGDRVFAQPARAGAARATAGAGCDTSA